LSLGTECEYVEHWTPYFLNLNISKDTRSAATGTHLIQSCVVPKSDIGNLETR